MLAADFTKLIIKVDDHWGFRYHPASKADWGYAYYEPIFSWDANNSKIVTTLKLYGPRLLDGSRFCLSLHETMITERNLWVADSLLDDFDFPIVKPVGNCGQDPVCVPI